MLNIVKRPRAKKDIKNIWRYAYDKGYRMYHHQHPLVIYRLTPTTMEIVRILDEKMNIKRHF